MIKKSLMTMMLGLFCLLASAPAHAEPRRGHEGAVAAAPAAGQGQSQSQGVVNINDATSEQLEMLPGVGPGRARAIIEYRKTHPFKRPEDLSRIKGIGKKTFAKLRPLIALSGATTMTERPSRK